MKAKDLKPGHVFGPALTVETVERDGDVIGVRFVQGGYAEYHADEQLPDRQPA